MDDETLKKCKLLPRENKVKTALKNKVKLIIMIFDDQETF